jgi:hypothetical protein
VRLFEKYMGTLIRQWKTMTMPENATVGRNGTVTWISKGTKRTGKLSKSGKVNVQSENWTAQFTDETGTVRRVPTKTANRNAAEKILAKYVAEVDRSVRLGTGSSVLQETRRLDSKRCPACSDSERRRQNAD